MVAVEKPSRKVFHIASRVAENSKNTKWKLCSVRKVERLAVLRQRRLQQRRIRQQHRQRQHDEGEPRPSGIQRPSTVMRGSPLLPPSTV
jgi:hypothetical protein